MQPPQSFAELLAADKRYKREAYGFVFEALRYAHDVLGMGTPAASEESPPQPKTPPKKTPAAKPPTEAAAGESAAESQAADAPRHLTGRQLCEAIRKFALEQFGFMAKTVLNSWGVYTTSDFGNIVFNLIDIGEMSKTKEDRREDFDDVFDFDVDLVQEFRIEVPKA